jgi:hypothetical protein
MKVYGVWSDCAGGFVAIGPTEGEAQEELVDLRAELGCDPKDYKVYPVCPDHEDEVEGLCSYCDADEDEPGYEEQRQAAWKVYFDAHPEVRASWSHQNGGWPYNDEDEPMMNTEEGQ